MITTIRNIMVYLSAYEATTILTKLGFFDKYAIDLDSRKYISGYLSQEFARYSDYTRIGRKFVTACKNYVNNAGASFIYDQATDVNVQMPFEDYLKKVCVRDMYPFYCYHKYNMDDFKCSKYLSDVIGKPLDFIVQTCTCANVAEIDVTYYIRNHVQIFGLVKKILTTYMIVKMAQVFSIIKMIIDNNILSILGFSGRHVSSPLHLYLSPYLKQNTPIKNLLDDNNSDLLIKIVDLFDCDDTASIKKYAIQVYKNINKLYKFFINQSVTQINEFNSKNPDYDAMIGRYFMNRKTITPEFLAKLICRFEYCSVLNQFTTSIATSSERGQVQDLRMPSVKIPTDMIVIEI